MNEVLADIYAITGDEKYLQALAPLLPSGRARARSNRQQDRLTGLHANTQIPKVIGLERIATLDAATRKPTPARVFSGTTSPANAPSLSAATAFPSISMPPNNFQGMLQSREGPETCNTYNMLRLTEQLFASQPSAAYADYYERALYNHILASIDPDTPGFVYFTPIRPEHYRVYSHAATIVSGAAWAPAWKIPAAMAIHLRAIHRWRLRQPVHSFRTYRRRTLA